MMPDFRQRIVDELENNTFVIFADASGASIFSKLRGATASDIGHMLGSVHASLDRQVAGLRQHIGNVGGECGVRDFDDALKAGRERTPYNEGLEIRERKPR